MVDHNLFAGNIALDLMRDHLPEIERAQTVADARTALAQPIAEARGLFTRMTKQADTSALEQSIDDLLGRLVPLKQPRIDRNGRIYDGGGAGGSGGSGRIVGIAIGLAIVLGVAALFLLNR